MRGKLFELTRHADLFCAGILAFCAMMIAVTG